jgi:hypothetical protein
VYDATKLEECVLLFIDQEESCFYLASLTFDYFVPLFWQGDGWEHGCNSYGDENSCRVGDAIWIRENCRSRGIEFNVLQRSNKARAPRAYLLRIDNRNLCMARTEGTKMKIRKCDMDDKTQLWAPWGDFSKFELRPYEQIGWSERRADCVSNLHHPKDKEVLSVSKHHFKDYDYMKV